MLFSQVKILLLCAEGGNPINTGWTQCEKRNYIALLSNV